MTDSSGTSSSGAFEQFRLTDRVALITGAGKGIGAAIATTFAAAGADVALTSRTASDLESVAEAVRECGRRALVLPGDVNDLDFLRRVVDRTVGELGGLDILVNNAGGSVSRPFLQTTVDQLAKSFHFNVLVPFELSRLATPHLLRRASAGGAAIVNIGSVVGELAVRGQFTHSLTKSAEGQLTRLMAAELSPGIRVNGVLPGAIETDALRGWLERFGPEVREHMISQTAMRRNGLPQDIANAVLFLASDASSFITGRLLVVDGAAGTRLLPRDMPDLTAELAAETAGGDV
jgi:7-alpha-hydroxysteroid dehydrogenase